MKLDNNAHSVFLMYYHLVLVVKYRRAVIDNDISYRAKEIFEYISPNYNITLQEWNHDKDHIHIFFQSTPQKRTEQIHKCIQKRKQPSFEKRISINTPKTLERTFLEPKFLLAHNRWCADRCNQEIYRKSR